MGILIRGGLIVLMRLYRLNAGNIILLVISRHNVNIKAAKHKVGSTENGLF